MEKDIANTLAQLQNDPDALGAYLMQLAYEDERARAFEHTYAALLTSEDWYLREVAIYALLFRFKLKNRLYTEKAMAFLRDETEELTVRLWAASGLDSTYEGTYDKEILKALFESLENESNDYAIRYNCLVAILAVSGFNKAERYKFLPVNPSNFVSAQQYFRRELDIIKSKI